MCRGSLRQLIQVIILCAEDTTLEKIWNTTGELLGAARNSAYCKAGKKPSIGDRESQYLQQDMLLYYQGLSSLYLPCKGGLPVFKKDVLWWDVWLTQAPPSWLPALQGANGGDSRLEHYSQGRQHHN